MNKADFEIDPDAFPRELGTIAYAYKQATTQITELAQHWQEIGSGLLGGKVVVSAIPEQNAVEGSVLGKAFRLTFEPIALRGSGYARVCLTINNTADKHHTVISKFLVAPGGSFLSVDGEELLSKQDWHYGYKSLVALSRKVLQTASTHQGADTAR